jgi:hypothetical protein
MAKSTTPIPVGNIVQLPVEYATKLLGSVFMKDRNFKKFHKRLSQDGMKFIPERARISIYIPPTDSLSSKQFAPVMLAIVPGISKIDLEGESHMAVSIVAMAYNNIVGMVYAAKAIVGHRPFRTLSFIIMDLNKNGKIIERSIDRAELQNGSPKEISRKVGGPTFLPKKRVIVPALSENDVRQLSTKIYREILTDSYERGMYPPEAIRSLLADTPLVRKWSLVESIRHSRVFAAKPGTSTSSSCNGCTSTSTSIWPSGLFS